MKTIALFCFALVLYLLALYIQQDNAPQKSMSHASGHGDNHQLIAEDKDSGHELKPKEVIYVSNAMRLLATVQTQMANDYIYNQHLPNRNTDAGLLAPEAYASHALKALRVIDDGVIVLEYNQLSGVEDGLLFWIPSIQRHGELEWRCETPSYRNIQQYLPQCVYVDVN